MASVSTTSIRDVDVADMNSTAIRDLDMTDENTTAIHDMWQMGVPLQLGI